MVFNSEISDDILAVKKCSEELAKFLGKKTGSPEEYLKMPVFVSNLDIEGQGRLYELLLKQRDALAKLSLPEGYSALISEIHAEAFKHFINSDIAKKLLPKWANVASDFIIKETGGTVKWVDDKNNLTNEAVEKLIKEELAPSSGIKLMNEAATAVHNACITCLGIGHGIKPMEVIMYEYDKHPTKAQNSPNGNNHYYVSDRNPQLLDYRSLIYVAFHEPIHGVQDIIGNIFKENKDNLVPENHRETLRQMSKLLTRGGVCPPSTYFNAKDYYLGDIAMEIYQRTPAESAAMAQGIAAELEFTNRFNIPMNHRTFTILSAFPWYTENLPSHLQDWNKNLPPRIGPVPLAPKPTERQLQFMETLNTPFAQRPWLMPRKPSGEHLKR